MKEILMDKVLTIVNLELKEYEVKQEHITENLFNLGMDSLTFIKMVVALKETFDCEIPDSKLLPTEMNTVEKIMNVLQELWDATQTKLGDL